MSRTRYIENDSLIFIYRRTNMKQLCKKIYVERIRERTTFVYRNIETNDSLFFESKDITVAFEFPPWVLKKLKNQKKISGINVNVRLTDYSFSYHSKDLTEFHISILHKDVIKVIEGSKSDARLSLTSVNKNKLHIEAEKCHNSSNVLVNFFNGHIRGCMELSEENQRIIHARKSSPYRGLRISALNKVSVQLDGEIVFFISGGTIQMRIYLPRNKLCDAMKNIL